LRLKIRSISSAILDRPGCADPTNSAFRIPHSAIFSCHDRALNLRSPTGEILSLVWPELGNGPFHAVLAAPVDFSQVDPADLELDLSTAEIWNPKVRNAECGMRNGRARLFASPSLSPSLSRLTTALRTGDRSQIGAAAAALAGLGPGLTPAGDDVLVGVMAGLWICPGALHLSLGVESACQILVENAVPRTTTLSGVWLRHAGKGELGEPWHRLAHALHADDPIALDAAVAAILAFGASSGADALLGFHAWMGRAEE
jgi:hypothetical protein